MVRKSIEGRNFRAARIRPLLTVARHDGQWGAIPPKCAVDSAVRGK